ncbi:MAG: polya polymerase [Clostridiales bacterium]|nr:polya polymerase [Clostridiales bacterium]
MKLKANIDYTKFLASVHKCKGEVYYDTVEGDRLNLKSTLSEYLFATAAVTSDFIENGGVFCQQEEDYALLADFVEAEPEA